MSLFKIIQSKFRLFFGLCPKCNSDAPEKDSCNVCLNFYGKPTNKLKKEWKNKNKLNLKQ